MQEQNSQYQFLEQVFDSLQNGVIVVDKDLRIKKTNKWMLDKLQRNEELTNLHCYRAVKNSNIPCSNCPVIKTFDSGKSYKEIIKNPFNEDSDTFYEVNTSPIFRKDGRVEFVIETYADITEQKQFVEETALLADMLNAAPNSITIHDEKGNFLYANQKTFEMHGYDPEEYMALTLKEIDVPESADLIQKRMQSIKEYGYGAFEVEHYRKDGTRIPLDIYAKLVDWKGSPALLSIATDISERKKWIKELVSAKKIAEVSEQRLKLASNSAELGIWDWDVIENTMVWDERMFQLYGIRKEAFVNTIDAWLDGLHPDDKEKAVFESNEALRGKKQFNTTFRVLHPDGKVLYIKANALVLRNSKGEAKRMIGINRDITEGKLNEIELIKAKDKAEQSEERWKNLFKNSPNAIAVYKAIDNGKDFVFKDFNLTAQEIDKISRDQVIEKRINEVFPASVEFGFLDVFRRVWQTGKTERMDVTFYKDSRIDGWRENIIYKLNTEEIVAIYTDVTAFKQAEEDLIKAKEKAEEANRLKSEFLKNMSHEIRTPMNGILGFSEMLDKEDITHEKRKYYARIVQNSSHQLLRIIDDILEISTLETKQEKSIEEQFCLNDLIMELFSIFNLKAKQRNIPIYVKKEFSDNQSYIVSDRSKLNKILSNLLENALKFTDEGSIEIGYSLKEKNLVLYVKDTGIGISPQNREIIFERFSQEDKEISRTHGGLGLGLSISKENAKLLGGDITLESEKGKGSIFYVTIPFKKVQKLNSGASYYSDIEIKTSESITILVAEDEEVNYLYIEALFDDLTDKNITLIHAKDGKEAVDLCLNNKIDLVLMDIKMPIMGGLEATEKIKAKFSHLPIIAQTAYSSEADKQLAIKHGCDDFISKPINKEEFFELIYKYLIVK